MKSQEQRPDLFVVVVDPRLPVHLKLADLHLPNFLTPVRRWPYLMACFSTLVNNNYTDLRICREPITEGLAQALVATE